LRTARLVVGSQRFPEQRDDPPLARKAHPQRAGGGQYPEAAALEGPFLLGPTGAMGRNPRGSGRSARSLREKGASLGATDDAPLCLVGAEEEERALLAFAPATPLAMGRDATLLLEGAPIFEILTFLAPRWLAPEG